MCCTTLLVEWIQNRTKNIHDNCGNKDLQQILANQYELNKFQQPLDAAKKMMKILEDDEFRQGEVLRGDFEQ